MANTLERYRHRLGGEDGEFRPAWQGHTGGCQRARLHGVESALSLLDENQGRLRIISFNQSEENLRKVLTHPLTVIITDGLWTEGKPHPRTFGTYPLFFGHYVRDLHWVTFSEAIHKVLLFPQNGSV